MPEQKNHISGCTVFLLLFLVFSGCTTEPVETNLLLPVEFSNVPEGMVLTQFRTDKIEIRIKADPELIKKINEKHIQYPADLYTDLDIDPAGASDSIVPGHYVLPVDKKRIPVDPHITILDISPSFLSVHLEKITTRTFKVNVPYTGTPAQGYIILEPSAEPASVILSGPRSLIDDGIQVLKTKPVDLTGAQETFKKEVPLDLENPHLYSASAPIIVVTVQIQEEQVEKIIENLPIQMQNCSFTAGIEPAAITISVKGPFAAMGNRNMLDQIFAFIDLEGLSPGVYARNARINIPVGLVMTQADPRVFTVTIE